MRPGMVNTLHNGRRAWIWALLGTAGLNMILFGILPSLMQPSASHPEFESLIPQINLIRIKRSETPPKKKTVEPPKERTIKPPPKPNLNRTVSRNLKLPFEINTRLPGGADTISLPPVSSTDLDGLDLTNLFGMGDLDQPLTPLTRIPPVYPMSAKNRGIEGWVKVQFIVSKQGQVEDVRIVSAKPAEIFNRSVIQCVSAWRFKPGTVRGMPVRTKVETTIRFELE